MRDGGGASKAASQAALPGLPNLASSVVAEWMDNGRAGQNNKQSNAGTKCGAPAKEGGLFPCVPDLIAAKCLSETHLVLPRRLRTCTWCRDHSDCLRFRCCLSGVCWRLHHDLPPVPQSQVLRVISLGHPLPYATERMQLIALETHLLGQRLHPRPHAVLFNRGGQLAVGLCQDHKGVSDSVIASATASDTVHALRIGIRRASPNAPGSHPLPYHAHAFK